MGITPLCKVSIFSIGKESKESNFNFSQIVRENKCDTKF